MTISADELTAARQGSTHAKVKAPLGLARPDVMERKGRDHCVRARQWRAQKRTADQRASTSEAPCRESQDVGVGVDSDDAGVSGAAQAPGRQRTGAHAAG